MRRFLSLTGILALGLGLSACGHNVEQRAATGGLAGLLVAGPVGAVVGAGAGVVVSHVEDGKGGRKR